jgi:hypothetical protein
VNIADLSHFMAIKTKIKSVSSVAEDFSDLMSMKLGNLI